MLFETPLKSMQQANLLREENVVFYIEKNLNNLRYAGDNEI